MCLDAWFASADYFKFLADYFKVYGEHCVLSGGVLKAINPKNPTIIIKTLKLEN